MNQRVVNIIEAFLLQNVGSKDLQEDARRTLESHASAPTREVTEEEIEEEFFEPRKQFTVRNSAFKQGAKWAIKCIKSFSNTREVEGGWISVDSPLLKMETWVIATDGEKVRTIYHYGYDHIKDYPHDTTKFSNEKE